MKRTEGEGLPYRVFITKKKDHTDEDWLHVSEHGEDLIDEVGEEYIVGVYELKSEHKMTTKIVIDDIVEARK